MDSTRNMFLATEKKLNTVSPSMCLAKWTQVTLHLGTGTTHSCHHPNAHKIPLIELQRSPGAIHNTEYKKGLRKMMLDGERPPECDYCWKVEDTREDTEVFSDRISKSAEDWAMGEFDAIMAMPWDADVYPTYVEVDFDTTCNFKCIYCSPNFSTTWTKEIKQHGAFKFSNGSSLHDPEWLESQGLVPIPQREKNPYVDAFWEWWLEAVKHMKVFRITGGEPLLSKNTFKVLDYLIENPQPQLEFNINSNLGVPKELIDEFITKMRIIQINGCVKSFKLYTSCEASGNQANYIRFGLDYDEWKSNCRTILREVPRSFLTVMAAFNILSISSFRQFVDDIIDIRSEFVTPYDWPHRVGLDTPYVRWPIFLAPWILDESMMKQFEETVNYIRENVQNTPISLNGVPGFSDYELNKFERLFYVVREEHEKLKGTTALLDLRKQFAEYIQQLDSRRGTDLKTVFPELTDFYLNCCG